MSRLNEAAMNFDPPGSRLVPGGHVITHDTYLGNQVQDAVIDFIDEHRVEVIQSPCIPYSHRHLSTGSFAHIRKTS
jgi:hypothetical protein